MYNEYDKCFLEKNPEICKEVSPADGIDEVLEEPEDETSQALPSFSDFAEKYAHLRNLLPEEWQDYLDQRDMMIADVFRHCQEKMKVIEFLDKAFLERGQRYGFKSAEDWIEKLILMEDLLDNNPKGTLEFLAKSYGVDFEGRPVAGNSESSHLNELKLAYLTEELQQLQQKLEQRERREAALRANAVAAKRAKEAAFAPQGKKTSPSDLSNLTTRQILERQFAALDE